MSSSLISRLTAGKKNPSSSPSWLEKHWDTTAVLIGIFIIAMMVRAYFAYEAATEFGLPYLLGGGADSHYNARIVNYIAEYNEHLFTDPLRGYPLEGNQNVRPPLYQWSVVLGGYLLVPFVGNLDKAINHSFILSSAFWGALTVFPTYLIGKRTFGKKAGIAGAFLLAISAAHLERGVLTNTNHDSFSMFFIVVAFFFFMRSLEEITDDKKWVSDWAKIADIKKGLSKYLSSNKKSMLYAAMAGISIGAVALTWKGYAYVLVIIWVYFLIQLLIDKFRSKDSLGITINIFILSLIAFMIALPWYAMHRPHILTEWFRWPLENWFQVPFFIFLGTFGVGVYFTVTRDLPWVLTFSIIIFAGVLLLTIGPDVIQTAAGQYFVDNKLFATIAEAQPPTFSRLVLAGGLATFFLSWVGLALATWHLRLDWSRSFIFILVWSAFAIYMATTAVRFIFNAAPAFALTAGWVLALIFDKTGFSEIGRYFRRHRGSFVGRVKDGVEIKHILVTLLVVFILLTPNALYVVDAGIPYEEKQRYEEQIFESLPSFLRPPDHDPEEDGFHYFGGFGYSLDKPTEHWPTAWEDLKRKNEDIPPEERPAFLSWWDYGFEAMNLGENPTVADNFQHAHRFAGNFLMAQNESAMLALLVGRQLQLPYQDKGEFEGDVEQILIDHIGEEKTEKLEDIYRNPGSYREEVLSNPDRYHPRADDIDNRNVRWAMIMGTLANEDLETLSSLYRSISFDSGYEKLENRIGYFAVDSRLFPTSARDTGIFHAPAFLSGHRVDEEGRGRTPIDFYQMQLVDQEGRTYDTHEEVPPDAQIVDQQIEFQDMFYNSALYRIFAGYSLQELDNPSNPEGNPDPGMDPGMGPGMEPEGPGEGIPGIDDPEAQPMPGWNLTHFNEIHRTGYFNPYPEDEVQNHTEAWEAMPFKQAIEYMDDENVTVDPRPNSYMRQGVVFLRYYDGAILEGQVRTEAGEPVPNAKVTVLDASLDPDGELLRPTPQHTSRTDEEGRYRAILPEGNITVMISTGGGGEKELQHEQIVLGAEQFEITEEQALRKEIDRSGDGRWDYQLENDFEVDSGQISGRVFLDRDGDGEYDPQNDTLVSSPGEVRMNNEHSELEYTIDIEDGNYGHEGLVPGKYTINTTIPGSETFEGVEVDLGQETTQDIPVSTGNLTGSISYDIEDPETETLTLSLRDTDRTKELVLGETVGFEFENLPAGKYTLEIQDEGYTLGEGPQEIEIREDESKELDHLTVVKAHRLEGLIRQEGERLSNQRLNILARKHYDREIKTDAHGEFSIKLPRGHYDIHGVNRRGSETTAFLDDLLVEEDITNYEGEFVKARRLSGTAEYDGEGVNRAELFVKDGSGAEYYMTTNQEGRFRAYLPEGHYTVYGWYEFHPEGDLPYGLYFDWKDINLNRVRDITLEGSRGHRLEGKVIRDTMPEEGMFARIEVFCEHRTSPLQITTDIDGEYELSLPDEEFVFTVRKEGYHEWTDTIDPSVVDNREISLRAEDVDVDVSINFDEDEHPIDEMELAFEPIGDGAERKELTLTLSETEEYEVELQPGRYEIYGDYLVEDGEAKYSVSDSLTIRPGVEELRKELEIEYKVKLTGDIIPHEDETPSAEISFQDSENKIVSVMSANETYELYLVPGNYSVRAIHPTGVSATQESLPLNESKAAFNLELGPITQVDSTLDGPSGEQIEVRFRNTESNYVIETSTDIDGELNLNVSHGEYQITVDHRTEAERNGKIREVLYYLDMTTNINENGLEEEIELKEKILNSRLRGQVSVDGEPVSGVVLEIPGEYDDIETNDTGHFKIEELLHGEYTLYTEHGSYAYFDTFEMPADDHEMDVALEEAVVFSGRVYLEDEGVETELDLRRDGAHNTFYTEEDGSFRILLPKDTYSIEIEEDRDREYYGTNRYTYDTRLDMDFDRHRTINLGMVEEYGKDHIEINLEEKTASQGEVVRYMATIENRGNVPDEYEFSADLDDWDINFNPKKTTEILPGDSQDIEIEVTVSEDAKVGETVSFTVRSLKSDETLEEDIPIEIRQTYGLEISEEIRDRSYRSGELTYTVELRNTGNGPDIYNLDAETPSHGWNVTVPERTEEIEAGETDSFEVRFRSTSSDPVERIELELTVRSEGDSNVQETKMFTTSLPEITAYRDMVEFEGDEFILEEEPFTLSNWHWAGIIISVGAIGIFVAKKKRWI